MKQQFQEFPAFKINGFIVLGFVIATAIFGIWQLSSAIDVRIGEFFSSLGLEQIAAHLGASLGPILIPIVIPSLFSLVTVEPNKAVIVVFFGRYIGTISEPGFWWTVPFTSRREISLRIRNFNSKILKVNDAQGSPIEIAAVVVWQVIDSAKCSFAVDDYQEFVAIQSETAIRALAIRYPYDAPDEANIPSLRGIPDEIASSLQEELIRRLEVAGVEVLEARLSPDCICTRNCSNDAASSASTSDD